MKSSPLSQFKRSTEISAILAKHGFREIFGEGASSPATALEHDDSGGRLAVRLRHVLEDLGPTFIKFGQILSTRPDLLNQSFQAELQKLQSEVDPIPFAEMKSHLENIWASPLDELFEEVSETPLAAASIAQVHRVRLADGQLAILKVRKPGIQRQMQADLGLMRLLLRLITHHHPEWKIHDPETLFAYFEKLLLQELDFSVEAAHMERFQQIATEQPRLRIPRLHRSLCNSSVLVMEFIEGTPIRTQLSHWEHPLPGEDAGVICAALTFEQIFIHGCFHGDPHPGNILITEENQIAFLDLGLIGKLDRTLRWKLAALLKAIIEKQVEEATQALLDMTRWRKSPSEAALRADVDAFLTRHFYKPLRELRLGEVLQELLEHATRHRLAFPSEIYVMIKTLSTMEGWVKRLSPDIDIIASCTPYVQQAYLERYDPEHIAQKVIYGGGSWMQMLEDLPKHFRSFVNSARDGQITLQVEPKRLYRIEALLDRITTRLNAALITSALIVGSSLIIHAKIPPLWHDVSLIGTVGYLIAAYEGVRILFLRKNKHPRLPSSGYPPRSSLSGIRQDG